MYICICNAVTEREIRECVRQGAQCLDELAFKLGVGAGCGRCKECAAELLKETAAPQCLGLSPSSAPAA